MLNKIVVFTGSLSYSVRKAIVEIVRHYPNTEIMVAHQSPKKKIRRLAKSQWVNIRKNGWRWIPYQSIEIGEQIRQRLLPEQSQFCEGPGNQYEWQRIAEMENVQYLSCHNLHDDQVTAKIRLFGPHLGIALAAPILRSPLFTTPSLGTINLHKGRVPLYRGMPPAFWELWNHEKEVGCTVHKVEAGLDTGDVLIESAIPVSSHTTVKGMQLALDELGVSMVVKAIKVLADGHPVWKKQKGTGRTFRKPTIKQTDDLNRRLTYHRDSSLLRRCAKEAAFFGYTYLVRPIPRRVLGRANRQRVVVLLYHRVNDDLRDSVTVGVEQFDRQMAILERQYPVVSIEDIIEGKIPRNTSRPVIAVTFDDGYLDNYQNAVPVLLRHKIPAAFFVSTGKIGSEAGFEHDLNKLGRTLPNMGWDHVAHMKELGFTIGSHTVTHVNCAKDEAEKVRKEIIQSKRDLEERLGLDKVIFSYPFGKREDINPEMLNHVQEVGYVGCLSAYGGVNKKGIHRFNVLRMGIESNFTDLAFRSRLEGLAA